MLNPTRIRSSAVIHRDRAEVWAALVDPDAWSAVVPASARIEVLTDRTDQLGSRWKTISGRGGRAIEVLNEVVELSPLHFQIVRSTSTKGTNTVRTTIEPTGSGTVVSLETDMYWQPGLRTLVDRLAAAMTAQWLSQRAMEKFKAFVEARP